MEQGGGEPEQEKKANEFPANLHRSREEAGCGTPSHLIQGATLLFKSAH